MSATAENHGANYWDLFWSCYTSNIEILIKATTGNQCQINDTMGYE